MEKTKAEIIKALKRHKRGVSREYLAAVTGKSDRVNRQAIADLRLEGAMIGTTRSGGYSLNNKKDFERTMAFYKAKTRNEEKMLRRMQRTMESEGQIAFDV